MAKPGKAEKRTARTARLSVALRENLKKRKQQAKACVKARARDRDINETADSAVLAKVPTSAVIKA